MKRQVIVVGAGPGGSAAAFFLAKAGVDVLLVDKETWPRDKVCGDGQVSTGWPVLKEMGVWDELMEVATPIHGEVLSSPNGKIVELHTKEVNTLCTPRRIIDDIGRRAAVREGADFMENYEATELIIERGVVKGVRGYYRGKPVEDRCDAVVIADGAHSMLARQIGMYGEDPDLVFYGARGYFENIRGMKDMVECHYPDPMFYPSGYMWVFPITKTKGNVGVFILESALQKSGMRLEDFFTWWRDNTEIGQLRLGEAELVGELKGWRLPTSSAPRKNYVSGALVVGDAGNMIESCGGGGQFLALMAGKVAAEVLAEVLPTGDVSEDALSVYKEKLDQTLTPIYTGYRMARELLFTRPEDTNKFITLMNEDEEFKGLDFLTAFGLYAQRFKNVETDRNAKISH